MSVKRITISVPDDIAARIKKAPDAAELRVIDPTLWVEDV